MKITLAPKEIQSLLAKALSVPVENLTIDTKTMVITIDQDVESLSFGSKPAPVVTTTLADPVVAEETAEEEPEATAKPKKKPGKKAAVVEEEIEEVVEEDNDDIDFL